jgi:hypothetical protein
MTTQTVTTKWEDMAVEHMVENYIRLKELERARNKASYERLKLNTEKYHNRLNNNYFHQVEYVENIKNNDEYKAKRKEINKRAYQKRKLSLQS